MFAAVLTFTAGCVPPDCERVDEGSCLNACCKLQWELPSISALDFAQNVSALLASGGPDGRFSRFNNTPPEQMWSQRGNGTPVPGTPTVIRPPMRRRPSCPSRPKSCRRSDPSTSAAR